MLPLALLVILVPFSSPLTLEEIWHKKWLKSKLTTTPSPLYRPGIIQHRLKEGKETKQEGKTRKESTTATTASESFCSTAGCVRAAAELLQKMDQTVDPCQVLLINVLTCFGFVDQSVDPCEILSTSFCVNRKAPLLVIGCEPGCDLFLSFRTSTSLPVEVF